MKKLVFKNGGVIGESEGRLKTILSKELNIIKLQSGLICIETVGRYDVLTIVTAEKAGEAYLDFLKN